MNAIGFDGKAVLAEAVYANFSAACSGSIIQVALVSERSK